MVFGHTLLKRKVLYLQQWFHKEPLTSMELFYCQRLFRCSKKMVILRETPLCFFGTFLKMYHINTMIYEYSNQSVPCIYKSTLEP